MFTATIELTKAHVNPVFEFIKQNINDMIGERLGEAAELLRSGKDFSIALGISDHVLVRYKDLLCIEAPHEDKDNWFYFYYISNEAELAEIAKVLEVAPLFIKTCKILSYNPERTFDCEKSKYDWIERNYDAVMRITGPELYPMYRQA